MYPQSVGFNPTFAPAGLLGSASPMNRGGFAPPTAGGIGPYTALPNGGDPMGRGAPVANMPMNMPQNFNPYAALGAGGAMPMQNSGPALGGGGAAFVNPAMGGMSQNFNPYAALGYGGGDPMGRGGMPALPPTGNRLPPSPPQGGMGQNIGPYSPPNMNNAAPMGRAPLPALPPQSSGIPIGNRVPMAANFNTATGMYNRVGAPNATAWGGPKVERPLSAKYGASPMPRGGYR